MSYLLVDDNYKNKLNKIVIETLDKDTFVLSSPTTTIGSLIGIKSTEKTSLFDNLSFANKLLNDLDIINKVDHNVYDKSFINGLKVKKSGELSNTSKVFDGEYYNEILNIIEYIFY